MKKIFALVAVIAALTVSGCAKNFLEVEPTDQISKDVLFSDAQNALTAINGAYRLLYTGGWGSGWESENGGLPAYILVFDLYAEDHWMDGSGSGWFYYDYAYDTWSDYTHDAGHSYNIWNFLYTIINNVNNIIASEPTMAGNDNDKNYVLGQAYALRAYSYWFLANAFCFNGGAANDARRTSVKGIPLYTEPTAAGSEGKGRGTIGETYTQMMNDINKAIELLDKTTVSQQHISHIDKYVANGIKARICMTQRDYENALIAAEKAMEGSHIIADYTAGAPAINDASAKNVLWALAIQTDQAIGVWSIFNHMTANSASTYSKARHLITNWLYDHIPAGDGRLSWWTAPLPQEEWGTAGTKDGDKKSYVQKKLIYSNVSSSLGDHILMRTEEMYLTAAEAACYLGQYTKARNYVKQVGEKRVANYDARLAGFTDSNFLPISTTDEPTTLIDEILLQRRIELWSEFPRMFDLQRLDMGFDRDWAGSNHRAKLSGVNTSAKSPNFILHIPDSEFDANHQMDRSTDQNPAFE